MEPQTNTYLRTDIRNILRALALASAAMNGDYRAGYQDALRSVATAVNVQLHDDESQPIGYRLDADINGEGWR